MIDGIVLHSIANELNTILVGGRIDKIAQPEKDELILQVRVGGKRQKLLMSSQATMPRIHITNEVKKNPQAPPSYCMLLRKYIGNGRILEVKQLSMERILQITLEQLNELGDLCRYYLIIEIMGKHSNIILCDSDYIVLDSIKRIGAHISSVRQVYPGKTYELPPNHNKSDLREISSQSQFETIVTTYLGSIYEALYMSFLGLSPFYANHLCFIAGISPESNADSLTDNGKSHLYKAIEQLIHHLDNNLYTPLLLLSPNGDIKEFHTQLLSTTLPDLITQEFESVSLLIDYFFSMRSLQMRMKQKTYDLRRLVQTILERHYKKLDIQQRQLKDTDNMETFKIKGELLLANQYMIKQGDEKVTVLNYYTNKEQTITLDKNKTPSQNANKAFDKYNKKKRTKIAVIDIIDQTEQAINYLESVKYALDHILLEDDIDEIRQELMESGYLRFKKTKKKKSKSKPYHYLSSDGFHMYVGKNNIQNEFLSTKFANNSDWWFHAKGVPGSHVIVKAEGKDLTDACYEEAAALAAYYSKARNSTKVTVDYTLKKNIKKPVGSALGYVIYHTNYSLFIDPSINNLEELK